MHGKKYLLFKLDKNRIGQCCAAQIVHGCKQYFSTTVNRIIHSQEAFLDNNRTRFMWVLVSRFMQKSSTYLIKCLLCFCISNQELNVGLICSYIKEQLTKLNDEMGL